jgi:hypothetical protein
MDALAAKEDVLGRRQFVDQRQVLIHAIDPQRARVVDTPQVHRRAAQDELARIRSLEAGDDLQQRWFPARVVADEAKRLAPAQVKIDVAQCNDPAEAFGYVEDPQDVIRRGRWRRT